MDRDNILGTDYFQKMDALSWMTLLSK
jgi:hypothetical protein